MDILIEYAPEPREEDLAALTRGLVAANEAGGPREGWQRMTFFLRSPHGPIVGGLDGYTHWEWLFVSQLWVRPELQGHGHGRALLVAAEREAVARGCRGAHLDTFDFQALPFYERQGYSVFGQLADFPPGHTRYFLAKANLSAMASA